MHFSKCQLNLESRFHTLRTLKSSKILYWTMLIDTTMSAIWILLACIQHIFNDSFLEGPLHILFYNCIPLQVCLFITF